MSKRWRRHHRPATPARDCTFDDLVTPEWTREQRAEFEAALPLSRTDVNVAVTGVTGSGKSTLINALCGAVPREKVEYDEDGKVLKYELPAREGDSLSHESQDVAPYEAQRAVFRGKVYTIRVWDSPGLEDGTGRGLTYVQQLHGDCEGEIDILLYCVNCSVTKCVSEDIEPGMTVVTQTLGPDIWQHAMIVLTFANTLEENILEGSFDTELGEDTKQIYATRIDHWQEKVLVALVQAGVPEDTARAVPVEPAGKYNWGPSLPDRDHWLGYLWLQFLTRARDQAKMAILINNQHRIGNAEYLTPTALLEHQREEAVGVPIVVKQEQVYEAIKIGTSVGAGVASATGACVGGVAGGVVLGSLTAGVGVGVGLVAGATVGAIIGPLVGMAVAKTLQRRRERRSESIIPPPNSVTGQ